MGALRKLVAGVALLICGGHPATAQTIRHHKVEDVDPSAVALANAESAIEKKDFATAEPLLKKVVTADLANYQGWFDLGFVYSAQGKSGEAIAAYRKSVAAKPDVFESNLNLGLVLAKAGSQDAEAFLRAATKLSPVKDPSRPDAGNQARADAWTTLARLLEANRPSEALDAYHQAATLTPKDIGPRLAAAKVLEDQNRRLDAEVEYKQVLENDPNSRAALYSLANIYIKAARYPEANEALRKIIALQPADLPANSAARLQLGRSLSLTGNLTEAIATLEEALQMDPTNPKIQSELADFYLSAGKYSEAEVRYRGLVAASPDDAELHFDLGKALLKGRNFPAAQNEFLSAVKLKPDFGEAYGDLAVAADENQNYDLAIKAADARAKFLPEIPMAYFLRATAFDHLREYQLAAQNYHKFLTVANGQYPDQEWQSRHRLIAIEPHGQK